MSVNFNTNGISTNPYLRNEFEVTNDGRVISKDESMSLSTLNTKFKAISAWRRKHLERSTDGLVVDTPKLDLEILNLQNKLSTLENKASAIGVVISQRSAQSKQSPSIQAHLDHVNGLIGKVTAKLEAVEDQKSIIDDSWGFKASELRQALDVIRHVIGVKTGVPPEIDPPGAAGNR